MFYRIQKPHFISGDR